MSNNLRVLHRRWPGSIPSSRAHRRRINPATEESAAKRSALGSGRRDAWIWRRSRAARAGRLPAYLVLSSRTLSKSASGVLLAAGHRGRTGRATRGHREGHLGGDGRASRWLATKARGTATGVATPAQMIARAQGLRVRAAPRPHAHRARGDRASAGSSRRRGNWRIRPDHAPGRACPRRRLHHAVRKPSEDRAAQRDHLRAEVPARGRRAEGALFNLVRRRRAHGRPGRRGPSGGGSVVSFTGSTRRHPGGPKRCAADTVKRVHLELGGGKSGQHHPDRRRPQRRRCRATTARDELAFTGSQSGNPVSRGPHVRAGRAARRRGGHRHEAAESVKAWRPERQGDDHRARGQRDASSTRSSG